VRNCIEGFTHVQAAGLGRVIAGNSINDGFDVALLVNGSTEGTAAGIVEAIALELADDEIFEFADEIALVAAEMGSDLVAAITFEFADEIAFVAAAVGAETAPAFDVVCKGNAAGSLGLGASSAHDTNAPRNNPTNSPLLTIES